jgi:large subunit ribosomal protein L29
MKAQELRNKKVDELQDELVSLLKEQFNLSMQRGMGEMPRTHQLKRVRKDIARVKTIMNEKERQA